MRSYPASIAASAVTTVAIIGTGLLGRGIASVVARAGYSVVLHDENATALAAASEHVTDAACATGANVCAKPDLESAVRHADLVIEAVIEDLGLKQRIFERMGHANPSAVLMSNSSVLPIGQIAARTAHPERAVGTHWWNPPHLIPVVEVVRGPHTSESVMQRATDFLKALSKTPVRVERDVPGFVGNRLQHAIWREALALVSDGVCEPQQVDRIVAATLGQSLAHAGPFAEMNGIGAERVAKEFASTLSLINSNPQPARLLREKVAQQQLGAKSGEGFLIWPPGARERAAQRLQMHVERRLREPHEAPQVPAALLAQDEMIARRLRIALWREALAMVDERVCDPATVDLMAMNTIGLRLAVMGPVENADYVGLDLTLAIHEAVLPSLNASVSVPQRLLRAAERREPL